MVTDDMKVNLFKAVAIAAFPQKWLLSTTSFVFCYCSCKLLLHFLAFFLIMILVVFLIVLIADVICYHRLLPGVQQQLQGNIAQPGILCSL